MRLFATALLAALCAGILPARSAPLDLNSFTYTYQLRMKLLPIPQDELIPESKPVSPYRAGDIVIVTHERALYYLFPNNVAKRYAIGVGRDGYRWSGVAVVGRKQEWPDWYPPAQMIEREWRTKGRLLPYRVPGGPNNPLGRAALYLFQGNKDTLYRVHGTNDAKSIGRAESSGCIRMMNSDIEDLYNRVQIGTRVFVVQ